MVIVVTMHKLFVPQQTSGLGSQETKANYLNEGDVWVTPVKIGCGSWLKNRIISFCTTEANKQLYLGLGWALWDCKPGESKDHVQSFLRAATTLAHGAKPLKAILSLVTTIVGLNVCTS